MSESRGRPRDEDVDKRILDAALTIFGSRGWTGFTIDRVAKAANVGKGSVYLRWSSKSELLTAALMTMRFVEDHDSGSFEGDLEHLARQLTRVYSGARRQAFLRVLMERTVIPNFDPYERFWLRQLASARAIIRRAQDRGEVSLDVPVTLPLDALSGAILIHMLTFPTDDPGKDDIELFVGRIVRFVVVACDHYPQDSSLVARPR